jgi:ATP-dependent Clp protease ATP-binding subunit ClpC
MLFAPKKEDAISKQIFEQAAQFRDEEKQLRENQKSFIEEWKNKKAKTKILVDDNAMLTVVSDWTGIPLSRMEQEESKKLLNLENELREEVIGQDKATEVIAKALRRSRADLKDPKRPIGSFMFLGPTGVGKTLLAKILAKHMFGDSDSIIQIDMSEYMEKFAVSRLIGSPPGYVGYDEGGQLTEAVRRKPYSVVLFDEIEKGHPDVVQLLLQVLEEGRLTDSLGRKVDFRNTILIMTSNVGADILQRDTSMGFGIEVTHDSEYEKIRDKILDETKRVFKPEFLNRLNDIVIFRSLKLEDMNSIVDLELRNLSERLKSQDLLFDVNDAAKAFIIEKGYDEKFGARPLKRAVERYFEDALAEAILEGSIKRGKLIKVSLNKAKDGLSFKQRRVATKTSS